MTRDEKNSLFRYLYAALVSVCIGLVFYTWKHENHLTYAQAMDWNYQTLMLSAHQYAGFASGYDPVISLQCRNTDQTNTLLSTCRASFRTHPPIVFQCLLGDANRNYQRQSLGCHP